MRNLFLAAILLFGFKAVNAQSIYVPGGTATGIANNTSNSNVGIGVSVPQQTFHVKSATHTYLWVDKPSTAHQGGFGIARAGSPLFWIYSDHTTDALKIQAYGPGGEGDATPRIEIPHSNKNIYLGMSGGNVGIGTNIPDAKLTVKGQIHSQEVVIDLEGAVAPDYVFEKGYKLPSLEEVQTYIDKNHHLPEIPSAKELDSSGLNVREMNLLLLKKIEELTLYMIEMKKENSALKEEVQTIKAKMK